MVFFMRFFYDILVKFQSSLYSCSHRGPSTVSTSAVVLYCLLLASTYVGSLYVIVPPKIRRKYDRDHPRLVQWRCWSCVVVCILAISTYPMFFCSSSSSSSSETSESSSTMTRMMMTMMAATDSDSGEEEDLKDNDSNNSDNSTAENVSNNDHDSKHSENEFSVETIMFKPKYVGAVLIHTMILYFGPIVASLLRVYEIRRIRRITSASASAAAAAASTANKNNNSNTNSMRTPPRKSSSSNLNDDDHNNDSDSAINSNNNTADDDDDDHDLDGSNRSNPAVVITTTTTNYIMDVVHILLSPTIHSFITPESKAELWINIRNYILAPLTEEIVFRGCMVPPLVVAMSAANNAKPDGGEMLLPSSSSVAFRVSLIAPLFFGVAHIHHAVVRLQKSPSSTTSFRPSVSSVILMTVFQFLYTTLFGMYATYMLIRTGSVLAVTVSHSYCNWMGLPDLSFFMNQTHPMYRYRVPILASYLIGVFTFKHFLLCNDQTCLRSKTLLPLPSELFSMLSLYQQ